MIDHDLIDNQERPLPGAIASLLERSARAHMVLGHLFVPGLGDIIKSASGREVIRLLIGNTTHGEDVEQLFERHLDAASVRRELERRLYAKRPELRRVVRKAAEDLREAIASMDQSDESLDVLRTLVELVEGRKLQFRIYPRGRLTTKAYLFENGDLPGKAPNLAILGTTNVSHAAVAHPAELNVGNERVKLTHLGPK